MCSSGAVDLTSARDAGFLPVISSSCMPPVLTASRNIWLHLASGGGHFFMLLLLMGAVLLKECFLK